MRCRMRGPHSASAKLPSQTDQDLLALGGDRVLDPHHRTAGGAGRGREAVDIGHDLARLRDLRRLARCHEAVLQIDDDQRGARRVETFERMKTAAARQRPLDGIGRNRDLMHGSTLPLGVQVGTIDKPIFCRTPRRMAPTRFDATPCMRFATVEGGIFSEDIVTIHDPFTSQAIRHIRPSSSRSHAQAEPALREQVNIRSLFGEQGCSPLRQDEYARYQFEFLVTPAR